MKKFAVMFAMVSAAVVGARSAHATTQVHANVCTQMGGGLGSPATGEYGWYNASSSGTVSIICGLPVQAGGFFKQVTMMVYDRNPSADITCEVFGLDNNGVHVYDSGIVHSNSSGPNSQSIFTTTPPSSAAFYSVQCTIPAASAGQFSHVTGFFVD